MIREISALLAAKIDDNPGTAQTPRSSAVASCRGSAPDAPARWTASAPIPKFASYRGEFDCELRNQRSTSKFMILVRL